MDVVIRRGRAGPDDWGVRRRRSPEAWLRLFCLPHAGAGAGVYRAWADYLAPDIEVVAIRLPGRETRFGEPPFTRIDDLAPALVHGLGPLFDRPHAWFGHSMGALIAFEVCRTLRRMRHAEPTGLLVSGHPAPHLPLRRPQVHDAPTDELVERLRQLSDAPREVLDDQAVLGALLPTLRADFALFETYHPPPEPPLNHPISVFAGADDAFATIEDLTAWHLQSAADCTLREFPGGHFFLHQLGKTFLDALREELESSRDVMSGRGNHID